MRSAQRLTPVAAGLPQIMYQCSVSSSKDLTPVAAGLPQIMYVAPAVVVV
jgi:hypothetical protein